MPVRHCGQQPAEPLHGTGPAQAEQNCPFLQWSHDLSRADTSGCLSSCLSVGICRSTSSTTGPLVDGSYLTRDRLVTVVRQAARINTQGYSDHSFCIGAATMAGLVDIEDSVIKCWADGNHPLTRDICAPLERL